MEKSDKFEINAPKIECDKNKKKEDEHFLESVKIISDRLEDLDAYIESCIEKSKNSALQCLTDLLGGTMAMFMSLREGEDMTDSCGESFRELKSLYYSKILSLESERYKLWADEQKKDVTEEEKATHEEKKFLFLDRLREEMGEFKKSIDVILSVSNNENLE